MRPKKIRIDKTLFGKLKELSEQQGYSTIDECAAHLLEQAISSTTMTAVSDDDIKDRLRGLGYIE